MTIGERIRFKRKELNLTLKNVHEITGISIGNLSDIERDSYKPSSKNLNKLCTVLHCSIDWILNGDDTDSSNSKFSFSNDEKQELLTLYEQLSIQDRREIIEIMRLKVRLGNVTISSPSEPTEKGA